MSAELRVKHLKPFLKDLESVLESDTTKTALEQMLRLGYGAMPVVDDRGRLKGMLRRKELAALHDQDIESVSAGEACQAVVPLDLDTSLEVALASLLDQELGRLPVVDDGKPIGTLSRPAIRGYLEVESELGLRLADVIAEISPRDEMFTTGPSYLSIALSALRCIRRAMAAAGMQAPGRTLDFACGHGRVLRVLKAAFPEAELAACDLDRDAVEFCARVFGATPIVSNEDPRKVRMDGQFDLIWSGSLLTHLDSPRWPQFLELLGSVLSPSGLLLFTIHGPSSAEKLRAGELTWGLPEERIERVLEGYDRSGFGYQDYWGQDNYGISLCSQDWLRGVVEAQPGIALAQYLDSAWVDLHDVVVCRRAD